MNLDKHFTLGVVFFAIFFLFGADARSELQLILKDIDSRNITVESEDYPVYYSYMRVLQDGSPVTISSEDVTIVHDNLISRPFEALPPDGSGWQKVSWYAAQVEFDFLNMFVTYEDETAYQLGQMTDKGMAVIIIRDEDDEETPDIHFEPVEPGEKATKRIHLNVARNFKDGEIDLNVRLDSVTMDEPFSYYWLGASVDQKDPPVDMIPGFTYRFFVDYEPQTKEYYRKVLKVHYEGGIEQHINLIGNFFEIPSPTLLNVVQPNGGELIAPCMDYEIKWKGHVKNLPTKIEYSTNGGNTWRLIDYAMDSTYMWKVPLIPTDRAMIRVSQELKQDKIKNLVNDATPVRKVTYDSDGYKLLAFNERGYIWEWDVYEAESSEPYRVDMSVDYPRERIFPVGIDYYEENTKFVAGYNYWYQNGSLGFGELAFFEKGNYEPVYKFQIPDGFTAIEMKIDPDRKYLILKPLIGSRLLVIPLEDPNNYRYVDLGKPISSFDVSAAQKKVVVAFYSGEVQILSLPDFDLMDEIDFIDLPAIEQIAISPNGKFLGIACMNTAGTTSFKSNTTESHVYSLEAESIVRTHRATASSALGVSFNPVSSVMIIGSEANPQVSLWDLPADQYIGDLAGHNSTMTDFKMSPDGHSIATSATGGENVKVRIFTYPEFDKSDDYFEIGDPVYSDDSVVIQPQYYMTTSEHDLSTKLCNIGEVPFVLPSYAFDQGTHFSFKSGFSLPDTLYPGECLDIQLVFNPKDTGVLTDNLGFLTCMGYINIPIRSYSIPRHIANFMPYDFGKVCLGDFVEKEITILKNEDPVDLLVNSIIPEQSGVGPFDIITLIKDTVIKPGESLDVTVRFRPDQLNGNKGILNIFHSGSLKYKVDVELTGTGIGAKLNISHEDLRFIPEIPSRKITIENVTDNNVEIVGYSADPEGFFSIISQLPIPINARESAEIEVQWNGQETGDVRLKLDAAPCVANAVINCGVYSGQAVVKAVDTKADPRERASIPFEYNIETAYPYNGSRFFEAEFTINPRMFLPDEVISEYGNGTLTRNDVIDDKRYVGFRVEGNFPKEGIIAEVRGIAGIAETDLSPIELTGASGFWGVSTAVDRKNGTFTLINLYGDRRVIQPGNNVSIMSVSPNPASDKFNVSFKCLRDDACTIGLYDRLGNKIYEETGYMPSAGLNEIEIDSRPVNTGTYTIRISQGAYFDTGSVLIVR